MQNLEINKKDDSFKIMEEIKSMKTKQSYVDERLLTNKK